MFRLVLVVGCTLAACGKSNESATATGGGGSAAPGPAAAAASGALKGTWTGSWQRAQPAPGGGALELTIGDKTTLKRVGTACPPEETPATVTLSGNAITIEIATPEVQGKLTGTKTDKEMSGELTMTCSLGTGHGKWQLVAR